MYLNKFEIPAGGKLQVGHVDEAGLNDDSVPIPVHEYGQEWDGDMVPDGYCSSCPAKSQLDPSRKDVLLIIIHQDGCQQLAQIRALLGNQGEDEGDGNI